MRACAPRRTSRAAVAGPGSRGARSRLSAGLLARATGGRPVGARAVGRRRRRAARRPRRVRRREAAARCARPGGSERERARTSAHVDAYAWPGGRVARCSTCTVVCCRVRAACHGRALGTLGPGVVHAPRVWRASTMQSDLRPSWTAQRLLGLWRAARSPACPWSFDHPGANAARTLPCADTEAFSLWRCPRRAPDRVVVPSVSPFSALSPAQRAQGRKKGWCV